MGIRRLCHVTLRLPDIPITGPISACIRSSSPGGPATPCNTLGHRLRWPPAAGNRQQITLRRRPICWRRDYVTSHIARLRRVSTDGSRFASIQPHQLPPPPSSSLFSRSRGLRCDQCLASHRSVRCLVSTAASSVRLLVSATTTRCRVRQPIRRQPIPLL